MPFLRSLSIWMSIDVGKVRLARGVLLLLLQWMRRLCSSSSGEKENDMAAQR